MQTPPDEIATAGEVMQAYVPADWPVEQALSRVADVPRWTFYPPDLSEPAARERVARTIARAGLAVRYVIRTAQGPVGMVGISGLDGSTPDVFYALLPGGRGRGVATRAVVALADWALDHGAEEVHVTTLVGNDASEAVARRAGFAVTEERLDERDGAPIRIWSRLRA
ncbi:GNAT family N-acetyltransferase [Cellulomonas rhizosphaerae]|uniref:N-acetyltransferase n=1 Tax=Cellulomonas rhizosphaerae TaxID=2293719 RepID=A0A413RHE1_9CELL|nr:GNAT family N-acetyltransferase [Cellulomonas rhizosphaerae]RHA37536.1 N-acetyltransferase [Cellulomonas rhizosphaerae]